MAKIIQSIIDAWNLGGYYRAWSILFSILIACIVCQVLLNLWRIVSIMSGHGDPMDYKPAEAKSLGR